MVGVVAITSLKNPRVKAAIDLNKSKGRRATGLFTVEGAREIDRALQSGYELRELFICAKALSDDAVVLVQAAEAKGKAEMFDVTPPVFAKMAMREESDGLVAVMKQKHLQLKDLKLPAKPLILAVQSIEKPGNLGALLRSADGAGVDAVVLLDEALDLYHPHAIRSSLGTTFSVSVVEAKSDEFREYCQKAGIKTYAAALSKRAMPHHKADYRGGAAIVLGSEANGLTGDWLDAADEVVMIPMKGIADSLNVSTAGAVLLYEVVRQRSE